MDPGDPVPRWHLNSVQSLVSRTKRPASSVSGGHVPCSATGPGVLSPCRTAWVGPRVLVGYNETLCLYLLPVSGQMETRPHEPTFGVLPLTEEARGHFSSLLNHEPYLGCRIWSQ